jgi:RluA family pseudouridine synthase
MARPKRAKSPGEKDPVRIVSVQPDYLVVDKRAGFLVHATPHSDSPTVLDRLRAEFGFVRAVHRLDRMVSGLLVFARNETSFERLVASFAAHRVERRYLAAVRNPLATFSGVFRSHLAQNRGSLRMYATTPDRGRRAVTHWWKVEDLRDGALVEVVLETGVKNQIRAQFAEAGHPLWGEQKYLAPGEPGASSIQTKRLFLHAVVLGFAEPDSGRKVEWESPLPEELVRWSKQPDRPPTLPRAARRSRGHRSRP